MVIPFSELLGDPKYQWHTYFIRLKSKHNLTVLELQLLKSYRSYVPEIDSYCCCDTCPVRNCSSLCCTQIHCKKCNRIIRICRDGWRKISEEEVLCMKCK